MIVQTGVKKMLKKVFKMPPTRGTVIDPIWRMQQSEIWLNLSTDEGSVYDSVDLGGQGSQGCVD